MACGSDGKESTHNVGDLGSMPGLGRFPEGREDSVCISVRGCVGGSLNGGRDLPTYLMSRACPCLHLVLFNGSLVTMNCDFFLAVEYISTYVIFFNPEDMNSLNPEHWESYQRSD